LKKAFSWILECDKAFQELKAYLVKPPLLSQLVEGEALYLYLLVLPSAISSALIQEDQGVQRSLSISLVRLCIEQRNDIVRPPKLALANPMESLAIYPFEPTCDQMGNHPYKNVRVNVREGE
jgi:hypothetical protein